MQDRPPVFVVASAHPDRAGRLERLAADLRCPLCGPDDPPGDALVLGLTDDDRLELRDATCPPGRGVSVDFADMDLRPGSASLSRRQPLARAVGPASATIADATAGMARDAMLLAALGHRVIAFERSPVVAALVADGLRRAAGAPALSGPAGRIELRVADARAALAELRPPPDVVYVDPMFPPKRKPSALPKKRVLLLRALVGDDPDAAELVAAARAVARRRVVVKRPSSAPPLGGAPDMCFAGKMARYDVYVTHAAPGEDSTT